MPSNRRRWNNPTIAGVAAGVAIAALFVAAIVGALSHRGSSSKNPSSSPTGLATRPAAAVRVYATGTDYRPTTIGAAIAKLLRLPPRTATPAASTPASATPASATPASATPGSTGFTVAQLQSSPEALATCARILGGSADTKAIAVDFARFQAKPAAVFVLPTAGHPDDVDVWVVKSTCSTASFDYYFRRVPRSS